MATRFQSEFRTYRDDSFRVIINDEDFSGDVTPFRLGGDGFQLTHNGDTDSVFSPIVGSSLSFTMYHDGSVFDTFLSDLLNSQETRFSVRVERWRKPAATDTAGDFRNRVVADDGTVEGYECLNDALTALGVGEKTRADHWADAFEERVIADGGTCESLSCLADAIDSDTLPDEEFSLYWTGYITQDLIEQADEASPRAISLQATDGISLLSEFQWDFVATNALNISFKDAIFDMFTRAGIHRLFEDGETMLTTVVNWYDEQMTYSETLDPLTVVFTDWRSFMRWEGTARRHDATCLEVIKEMAITFGARFYFSGGSYRFEQIGERENISIREFHYDNNGDETNVATVTTDVVVDQDSNHRAGGSFRYLPAIKTMSVDLQNKSGADLIGGVVRYSDTFGDELDLGLIPSASNGRLLFNLRSEITTDIVTPQAGSIMSVMTAVVRLEPSDGTATQYYQNTFNTGNLTFGPALWSTTIANYYWAASITPTLSSATTAANYNFTTDPLPKDGEIFIDFLLTGFFDSSGSVVTLTGGNTYTWHVDVNSIRFENDNDPSNVVSSKFLATNTNPNVKSQIELNLGSTRLADGAGALGSLLIDGSPKLPAAQWAIGSSTDYIGITPLMLREILSLQTSIVRRYEGTIIGGHQFFNRFRFDGFYWIPTGSTFVANRDELQIDAFKIASVPEDVDITGDPIDTTATDVTTVDDHSGRWGNINTGVVANMRVDQDSEKIGPFGQTGTGGSVDGDLDVTDSLNANDVQATGAVSNFSEVGVSGTVTSNKLITSTIEPATEGGDTILKSIQMDDSVYVSVNAQSFNDGDTYEIAASDYFLLISYTDTINGSGTINLPDATTEEGRLLRFKSDGTISSNKYVRIQAAGSDTIDGNGFHTMERDYDGIMLLATGGEWFIIQRKSK